MILNRWEEANESRYSVLKELQQELKNQDSDGQGAPRFWTVGDYEWVEAREENAERYSVYLPYIAEAYVLDDYLEEIKEDSKLSEEALTELERTTLTILLSGFKNTLMRKQN
ncbi:hypothetical protein QNN00_17710 [Bacillus velezensis]|nr:hypothetical protein [Bacillus velezensis]